MRATLNCRGTLLLFCEFGEKIHILSDQMCLIAVLSESL